MLLLGFAPLVPNSELDLFVLDLAEADVLATRLLSVLAAPTPSGNRIGEFDDINTDEFRYRDHYNDRYWR
jgi:hypothetical protein